MESGTIAMVGGYAVPVIAAPFAAHGLRPLFAIFLREGAELFGDMYLSKHDAFAVGSLMAKLNVAVLLLAWLALFTCECVNLPLGLSTTIALCGIFAALLVTMLIVRSNLGVQGWSLTGVGLLCFAGGNLPLLMIVAALLAFL